jgi:membrane-associated phospholipid phosphatase
METLHIRTELILLTMLLLYSITGSCQQQEMYDQLNFGNQKNKYPSAVASPLFNLSNFKNSYFHLSASTSENPNPPDLTLFSGIGNNILNSFKGDNLYLHLAGIASTALIISSNTDYHIERFFNQYEGFGEAARPVIRIATYFPFAVGGSLFAYGKIKGDDQAVGASFAVLQSSLIAFVYNSFLKAITGRPHPDWRNNDDMLGLSKTFRFGFVRGGIFWGWPSGHTSSTMAVISALTNFYPDKSWLKIVGYSYVAYMIFAVSSLNRGGMHWFSDAIAAAFMSYAIGSTVGKFYRSKFQQGSASSINSNSKINPPLINFSIQF